MSELQQRNEAFLAFLDTLNPAQREAVEQVEGPVLVVAGPGTGKTHLLTARIGNILLRTDARPQNILCLTFTDAGATAMRQRLLQQIGPEAQRVPIFTFHAFCNRIIRENAEYFSKGSPEPVSELERIELVRSLLAPLPPEHPLRVGKKDVFLFEEHLRNLFSVMKKEGWSPGFVRKKGDEFIHDLPANPAYIYQRNSKHYKKGDPKTAQIADLTEKIERLKAAADLFPKYLHAMERAARYEYEDMLLWVIRAFENNVALLRSYQERFQYILVDEFQDTNGAQFQLLNLLLDFWETPNIFIVGDDDQSIYEFQGARLQNLREFEQTYQQGLKTIVLEENYRSGQAILDASSRVIDHNSLRAVNLFDEGLQKNLRGQPGKAGIVEVRSLPNPFQESVHIAQKIENLIENGTQPSDIAVLYARHRQAERLLALLEKKGIAYQTKRPVNVLDLPIIQHLRSLLHYLQEESDSPYSGEHRLFRLLHASFWELEEMDLAKIAFACQELHSAANDDLYATIGAPRVVRRRWRELLSEPASFAQVGGSEHAKFLDLSKKLNGWIAAVYNLPLVQLLERVLAQSGLIRWVLEQPDKNWQLQVLHTFLEFVQSESLRNPRLSLAKFLSLLDSMDDNNLALPMKQMENQSAGVQLLTAHAAKGLEFSYVFLMDCTEDAWDKNRGGNRGNFFLPETLTKSGEEDALEARRRLFYVAMTRAKHQLYISFPQADEAGKTLTPSQFIAETGLPILETAAEQPVLLAAQTMMLLAPSQPVVKLPEAVLLDAMLEGFSMSVSSLNRYLRCPLAFYYEDVLKIRGATSESAAFGLAMHGALQQFVLKMKNHKKMEWPSSEQLGKLFVREMERLRGFFSEQNFAQRLALGKENLRRVYVEQVPYWRKRAIVERRVDRVEFEGIPLTGILDKIEWLGNGSLRVVDYKTGLPDAKKTAKPTENQPHGGEYWRQLAFYQILLEKARLFPEPVARAAISWLEADKRGAFPIVEISFSSEEIRFVENLIRESYGKIQRRAFDTGCGKADCNWCQMQRDRKNEISLSQRAEQDLDDEA